MNFGYSILPAFFTHGVVYCSGPDLVMPAFHFCVGFAYRHTLTHTHRQTRADGGLLAVARKVLPTRVIGLILISIFITEGWAEWKSWAAVPSFGEWLSSLFSAVAPYHTLTHIAFVAIFTFLPVATRGSLALLAHLAFCIALHATLLATFYFRWIQEKGLDEGGYFGFVGWSIHALIGALCYDVCTWAAAPAGERTPSVSTRGDTSRGAAAPATDLDQDIPLLRSRGAKGATTGAASSYGTTENLYTMDELLPPAEVDESAPTRRRMIAAGSFAIASLALMLAGYFLSCLGTVLPLTVCFDGTVRDFFGGFGPEVDCGGLRANSTRGFFVTPPFAYPDPPIVSMWSMTQRAGSVSYHLFTCGTSLAIYSILYLLCEVGFGLPEWWNEAWGARLLGLHPAPALIQRPGQSSELTRLVLKWHFLEVLGENSLAVYIISSITSDSISNMVPADSPVWYFLLWGELLFFCVVYVCARYLRDHKLFLRL